MRTLHAVFNQLCPQTELLHLMNVLFSILTEAVQHLHISLIQSTTEPVHFQVQASLQEGSLEANSIHEIIMHTDEAKERFQTLGC